MENCKDYRAYSKKHKLPIHLYVSIAHALPKTESQLTYDSSKYDFSIYYVLKATVHSEIQICCLFTRPQVVCDILTWVEQ